MLFNLVTLLYVFICFFLIGVVLLQSGKGGGLGSAFGGGGGGAGQQVFGGAGAGNILTKLTAISAALFMILSITLAYLSSSRDEGLGVAAEEQAAIAAQEDEEQEAADEQSGEDGTEAVGDPGTAELGGGPAPENLDPSANEAVLPEEPVLDLNPVEPSPGGTE